MGQRCDVQAGHVRSQEGDGVAPLGLLAKDLGEGLP
jgi:hypothetical protein